VRLAWLHGRGLTAIPKAATTDHLTDNWHSFSLQLSDGELDALDEMAAHARQVSLDFGVLETGKGSRGVVTQQSRPVTPFSGSSPRASLLESLQPRAARPHPQP